MYQSYDEYEKQQEFSESLCQISEKEYIREQIEELELELENATCRAEEIYILKRIAKLKSEL